MLAFLLTFAFFVFTLPAWFYALEVGFGCWPAKLGKSVTLPASARPRLAVLIPAHNESLGIRSTLASVNEQLQAHDRVVVVADNCTDDTAQVARDAGAIVLERQDAERRGKGYALAFGIDSLRQEPPEVLVFVDADCQLGPHTLAVLSRMACEEQRPIQALNLCVPPARSGPQHALSGLAFRFKNLVRMTGMTRLGGPCHLTGTGMALPWELVNRVAWASGNLVEDMQLGIDFTLAGYTPRFAPAAEIRSELPVAVSGMLGQRKRWEHGFLSTSLAHAPRLLGAAILHCSWPLAVLALDLLVPPLALLSLWLIAAWCLALFLWIMNYNMAALPISSFALGLFGCATWLGWFTHCRDTFPLRTFLAVPSYVWSKVPLYLDFLFRRHSGWVRADRGV